MSRFLSFAAFNLSARGNRRLGAQKEALDVLWIQRLRRNWLPCGDGRRRKTTPSMSTSSPEVCIELLNSEMLRDRLIRGNMFAEY